MESAEFRINTAPFTGRRQCKPSYRPQYCHATLALRCSGGSSRLISGA
jgi:hypothetical protein